MNQEELLQRVAARKLAIKNRGRMPASARPQIVYLVHCAICKEVEIIQTKRGGQARLAAETIDEYMIQKNWLITEQGYVCKNCHT